MIERSDGRYENEKIRSRTGKGICRRGARMRKFLSGAAKKELGASFALIGSVIGAGFITGREILSFFYGQSPLIVFFCIFALFFGTFMLVLTVKNEVSRTLLEGGDKVVCFFNLLSVASMLGATESLASDLGIGCDFPIWSIAMLLLSVFVCLKGMKGLAAFNCVLVPIMLFVVFFIVAANFNGADAVGGGAFDCFSMMKYVAMNVFLTQPLLTSVRSDYNKTGAPVKDTPEKGKGRKSLIASAAVISAVTALVLSATAAAFLSVLPNESALSDIPVLYVAGKGKAAVRIVGFTVALGIITTLVGSLYPVATIVKGRFSLVWTTAVCLLSLALSRLGFFVIVDKIYPALGVLAIVYYALTFAVLPSGVRIAERGRTSRRREGTAKTFPSLRGRA